MATKSKKEDMADGPAESTGKMPVPPDTGTPPPAAPASDYVVIVNLAGQPKDFVLTNARAVHCGPKVRGREMNRSKAVLKKHLTPHIYALRDQGIIALETPRESEVTR